MYVALYNKNMLAYTTVLFTWVISSATCIAVCVCNVTGPVRTVDLPLASAIRIISCVYRETRQHQSPHAASHSTLILESQVLALTHTHMPHLVLHVFIHTPSSLHTPHQLLTSILSCLVRVLILKRCVCVWGGGGGGGGGNKYEYC